MFMVSSDKQRSAHRLRTSSSKSSHRVAPAPPTSLPRSASAASALRTPSVASVSPCAGSAAAAQFAAAAQSTAAWLGEDGRHDGDDPGRGFGQVIRRLQASLDAANAKIERLQLQIVTLQGRPVALKVASEEAATSAKQWASADAKRYSAVAKPGAPADFAHSGGGDALREMLDTALTAVGKRVGAAIAEGGRARAEQRQAEAEGGASLEEAFARCKDPVAEHAVRKAAGALLIRHQRVGVKLRNALRTLEEEAAAMQATHAVDMRSLTTRLVAQRDAVAACVLGELETAEGEGAVSLRGLQAEVARLTGELRARDATIDGLRAQLKEAEGSFWRERRGGEEATARLRRELASTQAESASRQSELETAAVRLRCLRSELEGEEAAVRGQLYPQETKAHAHTRDSLQTVRTASANPPALCQTPCPQSRSCRNALLRHPNAPAHTTGDGPDGQDPRGGAAGAAARGQGAARRHGGGAPGCRGGGGRARARRIRAVVADADRSREGARVLVSGCFERTAPAPV